MRVTQSRALVGNQQEHATRTHVHTHPRTHWKTHILTNSHSNTHTHTRTNRHTKHTHTKHTHTHTHTHTRTSEMADLGVTFDVVPFVLRQDADSLVIARTAAAGGRGGSGKGEKRGGWGGGQEGNVYDGDVLVGIQGVDVEGVLSSYVYVCVCMCVCMHGCVEYVLVCVCMCMYVCMHATHACCVYVHVCMHASVYESVRPGTNTSILCMHECRQGQIGRTPMSTCTDVLYPPPHACILLLAH